MEKILHRYNNSIPGISEPGDESGPHDVQNIRTVTPGVRVLGYSDAKVVMKPWGRERWLHEAKGPYGFKIIRIRTEHRTSLQYHQNKRESYFLLEGQAIMHYRETQDGPTLQLPMAAGTLVHVEPGSVHRVEAVNDIVLIEVSTPDDGSDNVRLSDDYSRSDGRVESEH
jgi:mannose-6-phosphate isomerase